MHSHGDSLGKYSQNAQIMIAAQHSLFLELCIEFTASLVLAGVTSTLGHLNNELRHQIPSQHCEGPMFPLA